MQICEPGHLNPSSSTSEDFKCICRNPTGVNITGARDTMKPETIPKVHPFHFLQFQGRNTETAVSDF